MKIADIAEQIESYGAEKLPSYLDVYERELGGLFGSPLHVLELGVRTGGSLKMWRDLFPGGAVAGLDITPVTVHDESGTISVYEGFQQDTALLDRIRAETAPDGFDLVVDDASHVGQYTVASFWHLFRHHLKPGGVFVIEDWNCAYEPDWPDGHALEQAPLEVDDAVSPGRVETLHRNLRTRAKPVGDALDRAPRLKALARKAYTAGEGAMLKRRFPSHDYGLAGVVKQLVDACAVGAVSEDQAAVIQSVTLYPAQVFIRKL
jgi:SAM-dependent methyltransferase